MASLLNKANWALMHDEVRILIFDDPAKEKLSQRPRSGFSPDRILLFANIIIEKSIYE
jgi:hypothetical protein